MSNIFNWVLHTITGCPAQDKYSVMYGSTHCHGCGRVTFIGDSLPVLSRFKRPMRRVKFK